MRTYKLTVLIMIISLGGCISLLPEAGPGPDIYRLSAVQTSNEAKTIKHTIVLPVIAAPRELRNNRIALMQSPHKITYVANARWSSSTPEMLQVLFFDNMNKHQQLSISLPADGLKAKFEAKITLQNFEAVYDQGLSSAPLATVQIRVVLINKNDHNLIANKVFRTTVRSADEKLSSIVFAIDRATHKIANEMTNWIVEQ